MLDQSKLLPDKILAAKAGARRAVICCDHKDMRVLPQKCTLVQNVVMVGELGEVH